jgi:hypothetical protein
MKTFFILIVIGILLLLPSIAHAQQTNDTEPKGVFKSKAFTIKDLKAVKENRWEIQGTIKNISNESITGITMSVQSYNATGNPNGVIAYPIDSTMEAGQEYSFNIPLYLIGDLDHYIITLRSDR